MTTLTDHTHCKPESSIKPNQASFLHYFFTDSHLSEVLTAPNNNWPSMDYNPNSSGLVCSWNSAIVSYSCIRSDVVML